MKKTKAGNDTVMIVVDRQTKHGRFIPMVKTATAEDVADAYHREVVRDFGYPSRIISDRDVKFTSTFWKALF